MQTFPISPSQPPWGRGVSRFATSIIKRQKRELTEKEREDSWEAALQRRTWESWWTARCPWASSVPWWPRRPLGSWGALGGVWPAGRGRWSSPSTLAERAGPVSLEKRRLRGDLINAYKYLKGSVKRMGPGSFQWCPATGQGATGTNCNTGKFHLNMRKNFFTLRVTEHWNRLPREAVESPSLETFKTHLDTICATCSRRTCFSRGLD